MPSGDVFDSENVKDAQQELIENAIAHFYAELNVSSLELVASALPTPFQSASSSPSASAPTASSMCFSSAAAASELETCSRTPSLSDGDHVELEPSFGLLPAFVLPVPLTATPPAAVASLNASPRRTRSGAAGVGSMPTDLLCWNGTDAIHENYR